MSSIKSTRKYLLVLVQPVIITATPIQQQRYTTGGRDSSVIERPTEEQGAILMPVRVPAAARDFSPRVNFQCRLSYGVRKVLCAIACINILHTVKIPSSGSHIPLFGHTKILHTLIGMGIALLLQLVCLTKVRRPEFLTSDNEVMPYQGKAT